MAFFGLIAILAGLFTVVTGILGMLAAKCKKWCFTLPFAIFATVLTLVMLVVAIIFLASQGATTTVRDAFCNPNSVEQIQVAGKDYPNLTEYMKKMYGGSVDRYMCTGLCPCDVT